MRRYWARGEALASWQFARWRMRFEAGFYQKSGFREARRRYGGAGTGAGALFGPAA
jgi:hypothetical protein